jgi:hypothetical protein
LQIPGKTWNLQSDTHGFVPPLLWTWLPGV